MSWKECVSGYMERGRTVGYNELNVSAPPDNTTRMTWGMVLASGNAAVIKDEKWQVVDTIDQETVCLLLSKDTMLIDEGPTPCVYSQAEARNPPSGKWYHFKDARDREKMHNLMDNLVGEYGVTLYYVLDMYPLNLAKWMTQKKSAISLLE